MPHAAPNQANVVPRWLIVVGSLAIAFHLTAVVVRALAATSGPWPSMEGPNMAPPPQFAYSVTEGVVPYLRSVKLTHDYHFRSNRPSRPGVYAIFRLKDKDGQEIATVKLPEDGANPWVRYQQSLLAQWLGEDYPVMPPPTEFIAPPGQRLPQVSYWEMAEDGQQKIRTVDINLVPRDHPVSGPSEVSLLVARSYSRYLCRVHGAAKVEVLRVHQDPIPPIVMFLDNIQPGTFGVEYVSNFGEFSK